MNEEEFLKRVLNKIAKEFGYDVASTLELMFIKKEKELDQYKNNWEELKRLIKEKEQHYLNDECPKEIKYEFLRISNEYTKILNKMKELEEEK